MPKVQIKNKEIWVGGKNIPLISGEVHYWRLNPQYWSDVLDQVRGMGLRMISTYVPWEFHEHQRGKFDFTGRTNPCRNLKAFLDLTRKKGFWVIIRPGPYIYSEWPNDGVPDYAHQYHRLHPKFQAYAECYLKEVSRVIKPYLATRRGGHIVLVQADNEIDPWPDRFGHQYGLNHTPGMFQDFIRELYENDLARLNDCWGSDYTSFEQAGPFIATMHQDATGLQLKGDKELKRNMDYLRFKYFYAKKTAKWNVDLYRKLGYDVPVFLNLYPFFYANQWSEMQEVSDFIGVDFYPTNEFSEDAYEHRKFMDKVRYLKHVSRIPFIAEFESGVWHERHYDTGVFSPNHYRMLVTSALLGGVTGWNWYMLVNRDNWYMSPINEWGRTRPELYAVFKQIVEIFYRIQPSRMRKISDIAVTYNPIQWAAKTMPHASPILVSLYDYDIDYELYDPSLGLCDKPFLFYSGNQWLPESSQKNLRAYVEKGGTLIAFRNYPRKDDEFRPSDIIGFEEPCSILFEFKKEFDLQLASGRPKIKMVSSVYTFKPQDAHDIQVDILPYGKMTIGYIKRVGKGKIVHLGVEPNRDLIMEILSYLRAPLVSYSKTLGIKTALFQRGKTFYLVVINQGEEDKSATIYLPGMEGIKGRMKVTDLVEGRTEIQSRECRNPFSLELPRKDGKVIEFQPL
ncbi:MAG: hypothetical protein EXS63_08615 [Candidatus Omnitrophica bacterium]|nr:hypothetical protein [Candidatus Omnitrophota bacterium]